MGSRKWNVDLTQRAKDNLEQILLFLSQQISEKYAQSFLYGFYEKLEDIQCFPKMYSRFPNLDKQNIRYFIYNNYLIVYESKL